MGVTSSRLEDDKALLLCRERKHFVRQALDGRCSLAAAHVSYIQSLKNTGVAIRKFVAPEVPVESSLCTSASATPEPLALTDKSASRFSNSSPSFSQRVEGVDSISPLPSPYSGRFQVNYMKSNGSFSKTVEERPPPLVTATAHASSDVSQKAVSHSVENSASEDASVSSTWDYFSLFHPIDDQFSLHDGRAWNHGFENGDDIKRLREEEGIPELEEEEEKSSVRGSSECLESEDEFDQSSSEPLVRIFKNRNQTIEAHVTNGSSSPYGETISIESTEKNEEKATFQDGTCETVGVLDLMPREATQSMAMPLINGKTNAEKEHGSEKTEAEKENGSENKVAAMDIFSSVKEIELLFLKASEAGKEVPRMLEADKVNFRSPFFEGKASQTNGSTFFTAIFVCCKEDIYIAQEPPTPELTKYYLPWNRSVSSRSSSSRNPMGATCEDSIEDTSIYMNSGSHVSTLDRLYAWERKLYDEVKASGFIRRDYDSKCKLLRHQDSKGENTYKIDKTRAAIKDLHSRIRVALQRIDSISKKIEELRDKELQPQLEELIGGLSRMWEMMLQCHKLQYDIICVAYNNGNSKLLMRSEYHHQAAILLEYELNGLNSSFNKWMAAHTSYLQAIYGWLLKCVYPMKQVHKSRKRNRNSEFCPRKTIAPPIYVTCQDWLVELGKLHTKDMADAIKKLAVETTHSLPHQDKNNKNSHSLLSLPKIGRGARLSEDVQRNEDPVDWGLCFDSLLKGLKSFLGQLRLFAEESVTMYGNLGIAIKEVQHRYENPGARMQMPFMA